MRKSLLALAIAGGLLVAGSPSTIGQTPPPGTVSATGTVEMQRRPDVMRVYVQLLANGKDAKEALANLKTRRETATKQLLALGAIKERIQIADPGVESSQNERLQEEIMLRERLQLGLKNRTLTKYEPPVLVTANLQAELPLKAQENEALVVEVHALQAKIKAADLAGLKELKKGTSEEAEAGEEVDLFMRNRYNNRGPVPGEPEYLFVSRVSEADYDRTLADCFQKAKRDAVSLARAAEAELSTLARISNEARPSMDSDNMGAFRNMAYMDYEMSGRRRPPPRPAGGADREAIGTEPTKVSLRVAVMAEFHLKQ